MKPINPKKYKAVKVLNNDVQMPMSFYKKYINSDLYKQRLQKEYGVQAPSITDINSNVSSANVMTIPKQSSFSMDKENSTQEYKNQLKFKKILLPLKPGVVNINIDPAEISNMKKDFGYPVKTDEAVSHELSHVERKMSPNNRNMIGELNSDPYNKQLYQAWKDSGSKDDYNTFLTQREKYNNEGNHDEQPEENKADLDGLRYMMYKTGIYDTSKRNMTVDDLNKAKNHPEIKNNLLFKRLIQRFKPKDIVNLNNTIALNKNDTQYNLS